MSTNHNPKSDESEVVTTIRLTHAAHARLREIADQEHRTLSQEVRRLVDLRIAEFEPEAKAA